MRLSDRHLKWWGVIFFASIPLAATFVYVSLYWLTREMENEKEMEARAAQMLVASESLLTSSETRTTATRGIALVGMNEFLRDFDAADAEFRSRLKELQGLADTEEEKDLMNEIYRLEAEYLSSAQRLHEARAQGALIPALSKIMRDNVFPKSNKLRERLESLVQLSMGKLNQIREDSRKIQVEWLDRLRVAVTVMFVFIILFGLLLFRGLAKLYSRLQTSLTEKEETLAVLNTLLKEAPMGIALFDSKFRYTRVNLAAAEMNALPMNDHIGKSIQTLLPSLWERVKPVFHDVLFTGIPKTGVEISGEHPKSGRALHCLCNYHPVKNPSGRVIGVAAMFLDITERKEAEESLRRREREIREFLEDTPLALKWIDLSGSISWANDPELRSMGYSLEEYLGTSLASHFHDPSVATQLLDRLQSGINVNEFRTKLRRKDGTLTTVVMNLAVYREGGKISGFRSYTRFGVPQDPALHPPTLLIAKESPLLPSQPSKE